MNDDTWPVCFVFDAFGANMLTIVRFCPRGDEAIEVGFLATIKATMDFTPGNGVDKGSSDGKWAVKAGTKVQNGS